MDYNKRLFDCITHQLTHFPKNDMLCAKLEGKWHPYSTQEIQNMVQLMSAGLLQLGINGGNLPVEGVDKIGIISNNRPEWLITDMAVQRLGAVLIPIYPTTNPAEIAFILNDAQVKMMFVSDADLFEKIHGLRHQIPALQQVFCFNEIPNAPHWTTLFRAVTPELLEKANTIADTILPQQVATIIYTSGTTGTPKGVMLSHSNIYANLMMSKDSFPFEDAPQSKVLSFLPLNHIFERMVTYIYLFSGISIYYAESLETIGDNLKEVKPNGFTTVPRLLEKVFEKIMAKGAELSGIKRKLFFWAVKLGERYDNQSTGSVWYQFQLALANKLIFGKWREALGGNISFIVTGGAACQIKLLRIFSAAKIPIYEGYGPTENSPVICVNRKIGSLKFGTVGPPLNGLPVKLAEDGEILVSGPCVMQGYYKRPDLTAEAIIDGWLHTGDVGVWDDGNIKITDRKKELFKTSGGKYVAPQPIENKLKESPYIEQVMVIGAEKKFVGALIVPAFAMLKKWAASKSIAFSSNEDLIKNPLVTAQYQIIVGQYNQQFNHVEQIKKLELLPQEWKVETGELTPKMSIRRKVIMEKYKAAVDKIYAE